MELSKDVSLLILVPSPEDVCSCPGDGDIFSDNDRFLSIPVPVFEMSKCELLFDCFLHIRISPCSTTEPVRENSCWTSSDNNLELIELSSINKVSLV